MKKGILFTLAAALMMCFAACGPDDPTPDNPDGNNYSQLIIGTWLVDNMTVDGENMTPENMRLSFETNGRGLMNDNGETQNNTFGWSISGSTITITPDHGQFTFTITSLTATECAFNGNYMEMDGHEITGDIRFHMTKVNGGDPDPGPGPGPGPDPASFPAGTGWEYSMDTTYDETEDDVTYTYVIDAGIQINFGATTDEGSMDMVGTMAVLLGETTIYNLPLNESEPFTWTYNEATHTGTMTQSGVDDETGQPYTETINFTYNASNETLVVDMMEEDDNGNMVPVTYVFQRIR